MSSLEASLSSPPADPDPPHFFIVSSHHFLPSIVSPPLLFYRLAPPLCFVFSPWIFDSHQASRPWEVILQDWAYSLISVRIVVTLQTYSPGFILYVWNREAFLDRFHKWESVLKILSCLSFIVRKINVDFTNTSTVWEDTTGLIDTVDGFFLNVYKIVHFYDLFVYVL